MNNSCRSLSLTVAPFIIVFAFSRTVIPSCGPYLAVLYRNLPSEYLIVSDTCAEPTGPRFSVPPPKITSSILASTQLSGGLLAQHPAYRVETFDFPLPFGPTIAVIPVSKVRAVLSGKDLNPITSNDLRYKQKQLLLRFIAFLGRFSVAGARRKQPYLFLPRVCRVNL